MATAVLEVDIEHLSRGFSGLEKYTNALILVRLASRPVARIFLPVASGCISYEALQAAVVAAVDRQFYETWLQHYLGLDTQGTAIGSLPTATIAICTRDRPEDLRRCLEALVQLPDDGQEIIVIDNCPSDDASQQLVASYKHVRYVREERPGLNVARNRALREAKTDIVAFTDDDAAPDPGWLRALQANFADSLVMCVTGLTMPLELETPAQELFEQYSPFTRGMRRRRFDLGNHNPMLGGNVGAGVNMALRRSVLDVVGSFDEALDAGTPTHSGGDSEMFSRILGAGFRIVYDPSALNWHRHRRTWQELHNVIYGYGVGTYAAWTRSLLVEHELGVLKLSWEWFRHDQLPSLIRLALRRSDRRSLTLRLLELYGCIKGPLAYVSSKQHLRGRDQQ